MHPAQILSADILDILFEGKNKEYSAYELRKQYNKRLNIAMFITLTLLAIPIIIYSFSEKEEAFTRPLITSIFEMEPPPLIEIKTDPPPANPRPAKPAKIVKSVSSITIVPDNNIKVQDKMPALDDLVDAKIGDLYTDGDVDSGLTGPPTTTGTGDGNATEPSSGTTDNSAVFRPIEIESEYPGGKKAWQRFLNKTLNNYPPEAYENNIQGTVIIQFVVDVDGTVSDIHAISGPIELIDAAIKTIKKSGKWKPAIQNGRNVKSFKRQPITFVLNTNWP